MFDLESAFREWRATARRHSLSGHELDELEDHLHSTYLVHLQRGRSSGEAFGEALRALGTIEQVSREYRKLPGRGWRRVMKAGWAMFAVAFFLPVVDGGVTLLSPNVGEGLLPGFQAIRLAIEERGWYSISALTNLLMLGTMWRTANLSRTRTLALTVGITAAVLLNAVVWIPEMGADLRPGYYAWWGSFGLAAVGLFSRLRAFGWKSLLSAVAT